jgi:hypothetical protein
MDTLEQLRQRVENASIALAHEMAAAGTDADVLPIGNITVEPTSDGVVVRFVKKKPMKRSSKPAKIPDES